MEVLRLAREQEAELVTAVKRKVPGIREDGPPLSVVFDDPPESDLSQATRVSPVSRGANPPIRARVAPRRELRELVFDDDLSNSEWGAGGAGPPSVTRTHRRTGGTVSRRSGRQRGGGGPEMRWILAAPHELRDELLEQVVVSLS
eukprot:4965856-Pyramimonas_sp.AAC.2